MSGRCEAVAVLTGSHTELGRMSSTLTDRPMRTGFEQGTARLGLLLARVTLGLTAVILVVNVVLGRPFIDSVLFSVALAVGVTPQMLPAIVAVSLSTGARRMADASVIVRRLDAIEDLGSMDLLCTDKTGTLTRGVLTLAATVGPDGGYSDLVAGRAQRGPADRLHEPAGRRGPGRRGTRPAVARRRRGALRLRPQDAVGARRRPRGAPPGDQGCLRVGAGEVLHRGRPRRRTRGARRWPSARCPLGQRSPSTTSAT